MPVALTPASDLIFGLLITSTSAGKQVHTFADPPQASGAGLRTYRDSIRILGRQTFSGVITAQSKSTEVAHNCHSTLQQWTTHFFEWA